MGIRVQRCVNAGCVVMKGFRVLRAVSQAGFLGMLLVMVGSCSSFCLAQPPAISASADEVPLVGTATQPEPETKAEAKTQAQPRIPPTLAESGSTDSPWTWGGAWRVIGQWTRWPAAVVTLGTWPAPTVLTGQSRFRLRVEHRTPALRLRAESDLIMTLPSRPTGAAGSATGGGWSDTTPEEGLRLWSWTNHHETRDRRQTHSTIDRLDAAWTWGAIDLDLGRQPISLGTSHFLGVLDVLTPFTPGYLDGTYKPGVDALRLRTGFGTAGEAELIAAGAQPGGAGALLGRFRQNFSGFDLEVVGGRFRHRGMLGFGFEGERHRVTWWGELAGFERRITKERHRGGPFPRYALAWILGAEKTIRTGTRAGLALFHQDFGAREAKDYVNLSQDAPYREGWATLGGTRYGLVTVSQELTPVFHVNLSGIVNLNDRSTLWQPQCVWNTGDNADTTLFFWLPTGRPTQLAFPAPIPRSEFGGFPIGFGFLTRRFF
jgi:hypothetical protein